jgi:hypothetical protein
VGDSLAICLWKWGDRYTADQVNLMVRMIRKNLAQPHRLICFTDDPTGIECETMPVWETPKEIPRHLNCLRRVKLFDMDLADRMVSMDIDGVVTGPLDPLVDRDEPFVIWNYPIKVPIPYCGSMFMVRRDALRHVWRDLFTEKFDRVTPAQWKHGSDQVWLCQRLPDAPTWGVADGMYSFRNHCQSRLPSNARVVWFHGKPKPWEARAPWLKAFKTGNR